MFYRVDRLFYKGETETHSMQIFDSLVDAQKRFFNIIAADLADDTITYQMTDIMSSEGNLIECRVFDRKENVE